MSEFTSKEKFLNRNGHTPLNILSIRDCMGYCLNLYIYIYTLEISSSNNYYCR